MKVPQSVPLVGDQLLGGTALQLGELASVVGLIRRSSSLKESGDRCILPGSLLYQPSVPENASSRLKLDSSES